METRTRRGPGPRVARRAARERMARRRAVLAGAILLALTLLAGLGVRLLGAADEAPTPEPTAEPVEREADRHLLLAVHAPEGGPATSLTLLSTGPEGGLVLFVPTGLLTEIPGFGQDLAGAALRYGGAGLLRSTVENVLGVSLTGIATVSESGLATLFDRAGGVEVGGEFRNGARAAAAWATGEAGELEAFTNRQRLLEALLAKIAEDPDVVERLWSGGTAPLVTDLAADTLTEIFQRLARMAEEQRLTVTLLPVEPFGAGGPEGERTYRARSDEVERLVSEWWTAQGAATVRVQILNGVGVPGLAQWVDRVLEGSEFRVVLTENAPNFDYERTQIVVYGEDAATLAAARRVREVLGLGSISISRQPQSVVDLTIIVGADFTEQDEPEGDTR